MSKVQPQPVQASPLRLAPLRNEEWIRSRSFGAVMQARSRSALTSRNVKKVLNFIGIF